jgi:hypothetical protein
MTSVIGKLEAESRLLMVDRFQRQSLVQPLRQDRIATALERTEAWGIPFLDGGRMMKRRVLLVLLVFFCAACGTSRQDSIVLLVTQDGVRWQEVFGGAQEALIDSKDNESRQEFLRDTAEARREALMPFLWTVMARQGQIYGNREKGSAAQVTNGKKFSYPGYSEFLTGSPDPRINSNGKLPNPNVNVLEWLEKQPGFKGRTASFGTWDRLPYILNRERSGLYIVAGEEPIPDEPLTERQAAINDLKRDTPDPWYGNPFDSFSFQAALEHLRLHHPRVLYLMLGETDEWAHEGNYRQYLLATRRTDRFVRTLWEAAQQMSPGRVSLLFTTDHGRGDGPEWKTHGEKIEGAENVWVALMGPKVAALGERSSAPMVTSSQVAATVAEFAGQDYAAAFPRVAKPIGVGPR